MYGVKFKYIICLNELQILYTLHIYYNINITYGFTDIILAYRTYIFESDILSVFFTNITYCYLLFK